MRNKCACCEKVRELGSYLSRAGKVVMLCRRCREVWHDLDREADAHPEWPVHRRPRTN